MSEVPDKARPEPYPAVDYLYASLDLNESGNGEMRHFAVRPYFDEPRMEISIREHLDADDRTWIILNRRQIECLTDFLVAWLGRAK